MIRNQAAIKRFVGSKRQITFVIFATFCWGLLKPVFDASKDIRFVPPLEEKSILGSPEQAKLQRENDGNKNKVINPPSSQSIDNDSKPEANVEPTVTPPPSFVEDLCDECKAIDSCISRITWQKVNLEGEGGMVSLVKAQEIVSGQFSECSVCDPQTCYKTVDLNQLYPSQQQQKQQQKQQQLELPAEGSSKSKGPAIVYLLPNIVEDIAKAMKSIESLDRYLQDDCTTPLLLFNEGNIHQNVKQDIQKLTRRQVFFPFVDFTEFPRGFDPQRTKSFFNKRSKWGYWQMCRFWIYKIWQHEILDNYETIMRMDTDSCFLNDTNPALPNLESPDSVYAANKIFTAFTVVGLMETTFKYFNVTSYEQIVPKNPDLWRRIPKTTPNRVEFPSFYTNFEVSRVSFFRQPHVMAFQEAIADKAPFGVFRNKWGDAPVRYLTLALLAGQDEVVMGSNPNYGHAGDCLSMWQDENNQRLEADSVKSTAIKTTSEPSIPTVTRTSDSQSPPSPSSIQDLCDECKAIDSCISRINWHQLDLGAGGNVSLVEAQEIVSGQFSECSVCDPKTCYKKIVNLNQLYPSQQQQNQQLERPAEGSKSKGPAIVYLLPNIVEDIAKAMKSIESLDRHLQDDCTTPLLLFNEGNIHQTIKQDIQKLTRRQVFFPFVDFTEFPQGFDPQRTKSFFQKRSRWGYWQMCRFWIYKIWQHEILDNYETIMRMDTDSCFLNDTNPALPNLESPDSVYAANKIFTAFTVVGLMETTFKYFNVTSYEQIVPKNPDLWRRIPKTTPNRVEFPSFYTNFEVSRVSFFRQPHVMAFQEAIADKAPFGVFRNKWGDAPVRYLTLALLAEADEVVMGSNPNYGHAGECIPMWQDGQLYGNVIPHEADNRSIKRRNTTSSIGTTVFSHSDAIRWLKNDGMAYQRLCPQHLGVVDVSTINPFRRNRRFACNFDKTLPPTNYCGKPWKPSQHPYHWECRLKKRLFERIDQFALRQAPFLMLDLGSEHADWILAVGMYATKSHLVSIETNKALFRDNFLHIAVNPGLMDRVYGLNAAVMSNDHLPNATGTLLVSNDIWTGPILCNHGTDKERVLGPASKRGSVSCSKPKLSIPIITIDMIMAAYAKGTLFFIKIDLKGAEYEALRGGNSTFRDPENRPCIIIIGLKDHVDKPYKKAFDFLVEMGYTEYEDIDSGIQGEDSWPPRGKIFQNEGNYEFRLPDNELDRCAMRVLRNSQQLI